MTPKRRQSKRLQQKKSAGHSHTPAPLSKELLPGASTPPISGKVKDKEIVVQSDAGSTKGPLWFDLPKEIRLHILSYTDLVVYDHFHHAVPDLRIYNGVILSNTRSHATDAIFDDTPFELEKSEDGQLICRFEFTPDCRCIGSPDALLAIDHPLFHLEAMEVMLSQNRLVFEPQKPAQILKYLKSLGKSVRHIRRLDVQFSLVDHKRMRLRTREWHKAAGAMAVGWTKVAAFIRDHLRLDKLELAIDQCLDHEIMCAHHELWELWNNGPNPAKCFTRMVKPFENWGPKRGLKSFQVFLTACVHEEERAEQVVMGKNHEVAESKARPGTARCSWFPHEPPNTGKLIDGESLLREEMMNDMWEDEMEDEEEFWNDEDEMDDYDDYDDIDDIPLAARFAMDGPEGLLAAMAEAFEAHGPPHGPADEDMDDLPPLVD